MLDGDPRSEDRAGDVPEARPPIAGLGDRRRRGGERRRQVQVALASMGGTPLRAAGVEKALAGGASPEDAAAHAAEGADPQSDISASAEYRAHLAQVLVRRALDEL